MAIRKIVNKGRVDEKKMDDIKKFVTKGYKDILLRGPDPCGLDTYSSLIYLGKATREAFLQHLMVTREYKAMLKKGIPSLPDEEKVDKDKVDKDKVDEDKVDEENLQADEENLQADEENLQADEENLQADEEINEICLYQTVVRNSGYGILGENIHNGLIKHGYIVHNTYDGSQGFPDRKIPDAKVSVILSIPASYFKTSSRTSIGFTMFEATKIPGSWIERCNIMDRIIVPCTSNVETFQRCGVTVPIDIVPIGVDVDIYNPETFNNCRKRFNFGNPIINNINAYRFLVINDGQSRKNNGMIIRAFEEEFSGEIKKGNVFLIIRSQRKHTGKGVMWITRFIYDNDMPLLIGSCDCMISASSGEAGDIPILQGMAMEKPVVVTPGFVHDDYIVDTGYKKNGFFIESDGLVKAFEHPQYCGVHYLVGINDGPDVAMWMMPNFDDLKKKMRYVYDNREIANRVGKSARRYVLQNRTIDVMINSMTDVFAKLV